MLCVARASCCPVSFFHLVFFAAFPPLLLEPRAFAPSEFLLRADTAGPRTPWGVTNPPLLSRMQNQQHPSPWHHFERVLHGDISGGDSSGVEGMMGAVRGESFVLSRIFFCHFKFFCRSFMSPPGKRGSSAVLHTLPARKPSLRMTRDEAPYC